jgi:hypothetical protein
MENKMQFIIKRKGLAAGCMKDIWHVVIDHHLVVQRKGVDRWRRSRSACLVRPATAWMAGSRCLCLVAFDACISPGHLFCRRCTQAACLWASTTTKWSLNSEDEAMGFHTTVSHFICTHANIFGDHQTIVEDKWDAHILWNSSEYISHK